MQNETRVPDEEVIRTMALELREATGRLGARPRRGYGTSLPTVGGPLALANDFTRERSSQRQSQANKERMARPMRGSSGAVSKRDPVLAATPRVVIATTGRFDLRA